MSFRVYLIAVVCVLVCGLVSVNGMSFEFPRGEFIMVEPGFESAIQSHPQVAFDISANIHVVFEDNRITTKHMFGRSVLTNGDVSPSYRCYNGTDTDPHWYPYVFKNDSDTLKMFGFTLNTMSTTYELESVEMDMSTLPATPGMSDFSTNLSFGAMGIEYFDMAAGAGMAYYVYKQSGDDDLYLGQFDQSLGMWTINGHLVAAPADHMLMNPRLAVDEAGYVYLSYDQDYYGGTPSYSVIVRQSIDASNLSTGFNTERYVVGSSNRNLQPAIAVKGSTGGGDLKVAVTYVEYQPGVSQIVKCSFEDMGDWSNSTWGGDVSNTLNGDVTSTLLLIGPEIEIDAAENIYIVWTDDRMGYSEFFGNISDDGGATFWSADDRFAPGISDIVGEFSMAVGPNEGDLALAYIRFNGSYNVPMALYTGASYFDSCDLDPSIGGFWDTYAGVTSVTTQYFSPPASYQMTTGKGTLLNQYPEEMRGRITLQFYDDSSIITEDFYVGLENDNEKGVIRMLGVRNDTTQNNYAYSVDGGVNWVNTGVARVTGWHQMTFEVGDFGLIMGIEVGTTSYATGDLTMTAFTTIEMSGGSTSNPYYVDDIRIEAFPLISAPNTNVPSMSGIGLLVALLGAGVLIQKKRSPRKISQ